mmetsp:Transcript_15004/g.41245  ORF Transcript_15004/g.41245 Transcript_15004/m.41245 type:complete len:245 (+) Transcript_15004:530-1264(+)
MCFPCIRILVLPNEEGCAIVAVAFVVSCRKHTHEQAVVHHIEAGAAPFGLVAPHDEAQAVPCTKDLRHVPTELLRNLPPWRGMHAEYLCISVLVVVLNGIGPQNGIDPVVILVVKILVPERSPHVHQLGKSPSGVPKAAVHHQYLLPDEATQRQHIKHLLHQAQNPEPKVLAQRAEALGGETVLGVHALLLMVASHQKNLVRHGHLECKEKTNQCQLVLPSVDEVAVKYKAHILIGSRRPEGME